MVRMTESARPYLDLQSRYALEAAQIGAAEKLRSQLESLLRPVPIPKMSAPKIIPQSSKTPERLCVLIADYARTLFVAESQLYLNRYAPSQWIVGLSERVIDSSMNIVAEVEETGQSKIIPSSFEHHGLSKGDIRRTLWEEVREMAARIMPPVQILPPPLPPEVQAQMDAPEDDMARALAAMDSPITFTRLSGKQAARYARAGIDLTSGSPLLTMAHAEAQTEHARPSVWAPELPKSRKRIGRSIHSIKAARRMEDYIEAKGLSQTAFAEAVKADQRTLRRFRNSGTVDKSVAQRIAEVMGITLDSLLS